MSQSANSLPAQVLERLVTHLHACQGQGKGDDPGLWDLLARDLVGIGVGRATADALISWADFQFQQSQRRPARLRVLHPMERELLTPEAYGLLLDLHHVGLLASMHIEQIIENCAYSPALPADVGQVRKMAAQILWEQLDMPGLNSH